MPLAVVSGIPAAGKTFFSQKLLVSLQERYPDYKFCLINDESLNLSKSAGYNNANEEKRSRAAFISAVERAISKNTVVIADGMNYIKGYRYQLYCIARAASTPHCVIHVLSTEETALERNSLRVDAYDLATLMELVSRYEEPNNQTKWDSPLFSVDPDHINDDIFEQIGQALCTDKIKRPPTFATSVKSGNVSLVYDLDQITQVVIGEIQKQMKPFGPSTIILDGSDPLYFDSPMSLGRLTEARRQFIHLNRLHPLNPADIRNLFMQYLGNALSYRK